MVVETTTMITFDGNNLGKKHSNVGVGIDNVVVVAVINILTVATMRMKNSRACHSEHNRYKKVRTMVRV